MRGIKKENVTGLKGLERRERDALHLLYDDTDRVLLLHAPDILLVEHEGR